MHTNIHHIEVTIFISMHIHFLPCKGKENLVKVGTCTLNAMHMHTYFHIMYTHIHTSHIQYKNQWTHAKIA